MPPKYMMLIYLICIIMNNVHIYQICDEYFRYDVTSNVRIDIPEQFEFPSMTLCVYIVQALEWKEMSHEFRRYLLTQPVFSETVIETMVNNVSFVEEAFLKLSVSDNYVTSQNVYTNLTRMKTIPEILNLTKPIEKLYNYFEINGLFKEPNGSIKSYKLLTTDMSDFQFSIDKTFLHSGLKCFTLSLRPDLHSTINLNMGTGSTRLLYWQSVSGLRTRVIFQRKGYLVSSNDPYVLVEKGYLLVLTFEVLESIRLKYPYKTNCRDYSVVGLSSLKECREECFKSKIVARFGYIFPNSHAFASDNLRIRYFTNSTADITRECNLDCWQKECHSFTYIYEKIKEENLVNYAGRNCLKSNGSACPEGDIDLRKESKLIVSTPHRPFFTTEIQPAIPLVSFVTAVLSTFGFWIGLSVSGTALFLKQAWTQAMNFRNKIKSRQRLGIKRPVNQRIIYNSFEQPINAHTQSNRRLKVVLQQFVNSNSRRSLRTHHERPHFLPSNKE